MFHSFMGAGILTRIARIDTDKKLLIARRESVEIREIRVSPGEIEIRAAHEIMAARTAQLALLVDQLMPALRAKPPVLAGIFGQCWAVLTRIMR
jgi:uncharacterized membrane protein (DUF4010 family)